MRQHLTISPSEAADRLAIRELVEAYALSADCREHKVRCLSLLQTRISFGYLNAKDPTLSQEVHLRSACSRLRRPEQVRRDWALRRTEHNLHCRGRPGPGEAYRLQHHAFMQDI
jgi:hypothetical protein